MPFEHRHLQLSGHFFVFFLYLPKKFKSFCFSFSNATLLIPVSPLNALKRIDLHNGKYAYSLFCWQMRRSLQCLSLKYEAKAKGKGPLFVTDAVGWNLIQAFILSPRGSGQLQCSAQGPTPYFESILQTRVLTGERPNTQYIFWWWGKPTGTRGEHHVNSTQKGPVPARKVM